MKNLDYSVDICIVGGGITGVIASISAARHGAKVLLMQDRSVLGGNSSSEIRMWITGARGLDNKETGILEELELDNYYHNPNAHYPLWDAMLYSKVRDEDSITLLLDTTCLDCEMDGDTIVSVTGWQSNAQIYHKVRANIFIDCSGDSILAPLTGAEYRYGRESKSDFGETIPPDVADSKTMGMSCIMQIKETDHPVPFTPPTWAYKFTYDDLKHRNIRKETNYWWIEVGGEGDCLHDTNINRDELLKICYGVWDYMKNIDHSVDNWELIWIGMLPAKRESIRYVGKVTVTQMDVEKGDCFDDVVAYGGWKMDDHFPEGFYYKGGHSSTYYESKSPWAIPLRSMIATRITNLAFAGRNISVTHSALSSSRVMGTCALLGQAIGTASAMAIKQNKTLSTIDVKELQQTLLNDDVMLPGVSRDVPKLSLEAHISHDILRNGIDRGDDNVWIGRGNDTIYYAFDKPTEVNKIRLVFDSDINRSYLNMPCYYPKDMPYLGVPKTLIRSFDIVLTLATGEEKIIPIRENKLRLFTRDIGVSVTKIEIKPLSTYGNDEYRIFDFEIM